MKTSMLIALMTEGFSLVSVRFRREGGGKSSKVYHYKYPGFDVEPGDMVIVESPVDGFVIVDVEEVDSDPVLDTNAGFSYKWVVQKVDTTEYYAHRDRELGLTKHLRRLQNRAEAERTLDTIRDELRGTAAGQEFEDLVSQLNVSKGTNKLEAPVKEDYNSVPKAPTRNDPLVRRLDGVPFEFYTYATAGGSPRWGFRRIGSPETHKGFPSMDVAVETASRLVSAGTIK